MQLVHEHVTSALCASVFEDLRDKERARTWTLERLVGFWLAVAARAPRSLRAGFDELFGASAAVEAGFTSSRSSFFERSQSLRWVFVQEVFRRFTTSILPQCPARYSADAVAGLGHFEEIWAVDGTGLDRVAKRLNAVRDVDEVVLPGSPIACYDLRRGIPRVLEYSERLLGGESLRLEEMLDQIPDGALLIADRGYSSLRMLGAVEERGLSAIMRMRRGYVMETLEELSAFEDEGCAVHDRLVQMGSKEGGKLIRIVEKVLADGTLLRLATTVQDPARLSAEQILSLYRERWSVERMFHDLKVVLNLRRFYAANTNAVALQLFTSAIVYTALRVTQDRIAEDHGLEPERLSTAKLFPRAASAHIRLVQSLRVFELVKKANPDVELNEPSWAEAGLCSVPLSQLLLDKRTRPRRGKRPYSPKRRKSRPLSDFETP